MRLREKARKLGQPPRLLVVTAVAAEREAFERGVASAGPGTLDVTVIEGGVGMAHAAAVTAAAIHRRSAGDEAILGVISAGIGGGFDVPPGGLALGRRSVAADLGAQTPDGFLSLDELGLGSSTVESDVDMLELLGDALPDAAVGSVLTVSTVTGTADRCAALRARHPDAVAEAMEGFGVATAAARVGLPFAEIRAISNPVGPRDRAGWRIPEALAALERAAAALARTGAALRQTG